MILRHITRVMLAGIVVILPVFGSILAFVWIEASLASAWKSVPSLANWYFPGLGIVALLLAIYVVGLGVTTFVGRWLFRKVDVLLDSLPLLGPLYRSLKQILGYGEGRDALFERVVWVRSREHEAEELGLVTRDVGPDARAIVFVPGSPNPTTGRLLLASATSLRPADMSVHDALKTLVALGKLDSDVSTS